MLSYAPALGRYSRLRDKPQLTQQTARRIVIQRSLENSSITSTVLLYLGTLFVRFLLSDFSSFNVIITAMFAFLNHQITSAAICTVATFGPHKGLLATKTSLRWT